MEVGRGLTLACLLIFVVVLGLIPAEGKTHYDPKYGRRNITMGIRKYGDRLLYNERHVGEKKFLRVISKDVMYPPKTNPKNIKITYFQVLDMYHNDHSGYAFQTAGGVGMGFVGFHLKSQRNHGFDFNVAIYGYQY